MSDSATPTPLVDANDAVNILMVDDSPDKLLAMSSILESLDVTIIKAKSGLEALRLLLKQEFAVILLDVNMPDMDGFETAQMIRSRPSLEHIPILFVTALSTTDSDIFKGYSFGAVDYVLTPILPEILRTKVGVFVELWKQRRALQTHAESLRKLNSDLTQRAEQLSEVNRELESFCYTIAHDLRAPLRAMEGLTATLVDDVGDALTQDGHETAERIRQAAARMDQMIQELLSYSRLTFIAMDLAPIKLDDVFKDAMAQIDYELCQRKARVQIKRPRHLVLGQHPMLVQVVCNLICNAIKFCAEGVTPEVTIWEEKQNGAVRVWVEDNGIGIAAEHCDRIFRIFERLHDRDHYSGTGIGLAIVHKAIARMGGRVGVVSQLGQGSRFWFELPHHQPPKQTKLELDSAEEEQPAPEPAENPEAAAN